MHIMLPTTAIKIKDRQRSVDPNVKTHITQLAEEIKRDGLIHAISISKEQDLIAGWCRLKAIELLKEPYFYANAEILPGFAPCIVMHQMNEQETFRVELMENLRRRNLSPMDEARAITKLHSYFVVENKGNWTKSQTGEKLAEIRGKTKENPVSTAEISDNILINSFEFDPEVQKAKSKGEAIKLVKKKLEQSFMQGLGKLQIGKETNKDFTLLSGKLEDILPTIDSESFHGILVDPPYGIDADLFGEQAMKTGHQYQDDLVGALTRCSIIFSEGFRVCKETAHLYMFCDIRVFPSLKILAEENNWKVFPTPLIWNKQNIGHTPQPGFFSRRYECILFAQKGNRTLNGARSDVFDFPGMKNKIHAAQKPRELYEELLSLSFFPGEHILDCCCGAGTIFYAAKTKKMKATGIELPGTYADICSEVIASLEDK